MADARQACDGVSTVASGPDRRPAGSRRGGHAGRCPGDRPAWPVPEHRCVARVPASPRPRVAASPAAGEL